jgi:hypothetical protein
MRWNFSGHGHDPRQVDLFAVIVLILVSVGAYFYFTNSSSPPPNRTAFIVPSQHVRW